MRITSKGQVTIPVEVRERAGLLPQTEVEFEYRRGAVVLRKVRGRKRRAGKRPSRGEALVARMAGKATSRLTTEEIMALTRGE
jgi:AbrB family looped-hinge helix DNA binding protein